MEFTIVGIIDPGVAGKERLQLKATTGGDIGKYLVFDTVQTAPGKIFSIPQNTYWFPDRNIGPGDTVVLYTKAGKNFERKKEDGTTVWFFYWGKELPLWADSKSSVALLKIAAWDYKVRP